jgi:hypothetical protein
LAQNWFVSWHETRKQQNNFNLKVMKTTKQVQKTGNRKLISTIFMLALGLSSFQSMAGSETTKPTIAPVKPKETIASANTCENNQQTILAFAATTTSGKQLVTNATNRVCYEQIEQEKTLAIESWMLDSRNFGLTKSEDESIGNENCRLNLG